MPSSAYRKSTRLNSSHTLISYAVFCLSEEHTSELQHTLISYAVFCLKKKDFEFDTSTQAGTNNDGQKVTFAQIYNWRGETAREQIFSVLNQVLNDPSLTLKVFAYDFNEPDIAKILLTLAEQGRVRIILDNASLHVTAAGKDET